MGVMGRYAKNGREKLVVAGILPPSPSLRGYLPLRGQVRVRWGTVGTDGTREAAW